MLNTQCEQSVFNLGISQAKRIVRRTNRIDIRGARRSVAIAHMCTDCLLTGSLKFIPSGPLVVCASLDPLPENLETLQSLRGG